MRATLDSERTALEHKIADNQNRKKEVEALLEVWEHENADAFQRLARLEASYHDSLQRSRSLDAVPDYQHLVSAASIISLASANTGDAGRFHIW